MDTSGFLPRIEAPDAEDLPDGMYRVPITPDAVEDRGRGRDFRTGYGPEISQTRMPQPTARDLVVPRVYLEPDEQIDRLRVRAFRWAIVRDTVIIVLGLSLVWRWVLLPLWQVIGG